MSGLLNFLESAATAGADMMESDRKIEAERIKQEELLKTPSLLRELL